jgi:hypothetical protein
VSGAGLEDAVAALLAERTGRPCLFLPSGRLALFLALRAWLSPGDRILMSPVNDDVILFVVLAAGLRPVMAPVSADDGNIDPAAVPDATWSSLDGVLTTNLYGLPDRVEELADRCRRLGIPLIEDAAHAIQTEVGGRPIGAFGAAAAFSFSKHAGAGGGGALAFADPRRRPGLEALRDQLLRPPRWRSGAADLSLPAAERLVYRARLVRPARYLRRALGLAERSAYRMPLRAPLLEGAVAAAPGLDRFEPWVRVDLPRSSPRPRPAAPPTARPGPWSGCTAGLSAWSTWPSTRAGWPRTPWPGGSGTGWPRPSGATWPPTAGRPRPGSRSRAWAPAPAGPPSRWTRPPWPAWSWPPGTAPRERWPAWRGCCAWTTPTSRSCWSTTPPPRRRPPRRWPAASATGPRSATSARTGPACPAPATGGWPRPPARWSPSPTTTCWSTGPGWPTWSPPWARPPTWPAPPA